MDSNSGRSDDLESNILKRPLSVRFVERIDPAETVIILFSRNLPQAILHYSKCYDKLPEFKILDVQEGKDILINMITCFNVSIGVPQFKHEYLNKEVCLYVPKASTPYDEFGFLRTFEAVKALGLHSPLLVEQVTIMDYRGCFFFPPLSNVFWQENRELAL